MTLYFATNLLYLIPILVIGAVFLIVLALYRERSDLTKRMADLDGTKISLATPAAEAAVSKFIAGERHNKLSRLLVEGGWYNLTPTTFVLRSIIGGLIGAGAAIAFVVYTHRLSTMTVPLIAMAGAYGCYKPFGDLMSAIKRRKIQVQISIPNLLDLLSSTVSAGIALNGALNYAVEAIPGALGEELASTLSDIRLGAPRGDALTGLANRVAVPDLTQAIRAIVQAEKLGTNMATMLSELADDSRSRRLLRAEEMGAALPVKLTFPMCLCMLPAILVLIAGVAIGDFASPMLDMQLAHIRNEITGHS